MSKVSVIIPTYNSEKYLGAAIESVLRQTYKDIEIIVIDDGSTDKTVNIIEKYSRKIIAVTQENNGVASARNKGLEIATGKYISFLDADDIILPQKLEMQVDFLDKNPNYGIIHSSWYYLTPEKQYIPFPMKHRKPHQILEKMLTSNDVIIHACLARANCFQKYGVFKTGIEMAEDLDLWLRFAANNVLFHTQYENLVIYRIHNENTHSLKTTHPSRLEIIKDFFDNNELPEDIKDLKNKVFASNYTIWAGAYFRNKDYENGKKYLKEALFHNHNKKPDGFGVFRLLIPLKIYGVDDSRVKNINLNEMSDLICDVIQFISDLKIYNDEQMKTFKIGIYAECARIAYDCRNIPLALFAFKKLYELGDISSIQYQKQKAKCLYRNINKGKSWIEKQPKIDSSIIEFVNECEKAAKL